jgi:hypothetical protein
MRISTAESNRGVPLLAALCLGVAITLTIHKLRENRWPGERVIVSTSTGPNTPTSSGELQPKSDPSAGSGIGDQISFMTLILTLLTGIAVQYITTSLGTIKQYRDEVDSEVALKRNFDDLKAKLVVDEFKRARSNFYVDFSELYLKESLSHGVQVITEKQGRLLADLSVLRRTFHPFDWPVDPKHAPPNNLRSVFQAIRAVTAQDRKAARSLLRPEHVDYLRRFWEHLDNDPKLSDQARREWGEIMKSLERVLYEDRKSS